MGPRWEGLRALEAGLLEDARAWCRGRSPWVRAPLLAWGAWMLLQHLRSDAYRSLFAGLNLGIHELGHVVALPLGMTMHMLGGTLAQVAAPLVGVWMFLRQRDYFAVSFALAWLGTNLFEVAAYAGDARARALPLVSPFAGEPLHDWHFLLSKAGLLGWDGAIAFVLRLGGVTAFVAFLVGGTWLLVQMRRPAGTEAPLSEELELRRWGR